MALRLQFTKILRFNLSLVEPYDEKPHFLQRLDCQVKRDRSVEFRATKRENATETMMTITISVSENSRP